jgi:hypothetical protein
MITGFNYTLYTSIMYVEYFAYLLGINRPARNLLARRSDIYPRETVAGVSFATVILTSFDLVRHGYSSNGVERSRHDMVRHRSKSNGEKHSPHGSERPHSNPFGPAFKPFVLEFVAIDPERSETQRFGTVQSGTAGPCFPMALILYPGLRNDPESPRSHCDQPTINVSESSAPRQIHIIEKSGLGRVTTYSRIPFPCLVSPLLPPSSHQQKRGRSETSEKPF